MPLSLAAISGIAAGSSALLGAGQLIQGYSRQRKANQAAEQAVTDLLKVRERNLLAGLQIPTMGAELQERALARATAGQVEAMQEAGAAGVIGGAGRLTQSVGEQAAAQAAEIDRMQKQRDMMVLQQEQEIETRQKGIERGVEQMRLAGAQQEAASAAEQVQAGFGSIASGIALGADIYASGLNPYGTQTTTPTPLQSNQVPSLGAANTYSSTYTVPSGQGPLVNPPVYSSYYSPIQSVLQPNN